MNVHTPVKRKPLTPLQRAKLFLEHQGKCCICTIKIGMNEPWIDEHINPLGLTGTNDWSNRGPAHVDCAKAKTKDDVAQIAKAKRRQAKFIGAKKPKKPWPKRGEWKDNTKYINQEEL